MNDVAKKYGTPDSYFLEIIRQAGFNPIGITVMTCEETFIFETEEERTKAAEQFLPEGWYYIRDEWDETRTWYVNDMYNSIEEDAPKVYWL